MTPRLVFRPEAEAELLEARRWYDAQLAGLGNAFAAEVDGAVKGILRNPLFHPRVHGDTRRALINRFPYAVYFQIFPEEIVVLAVMHGRRHPLRWRVRR